MYSVQTAVSDGTLVSVAIGIEFIDKAHIHVYRSDTEAELVSGLDYTWIGDVLITLTAVVPSGITVILLRRTIFDNMLNSFVGGAPFTRVALDENFQQSLYIAQEFTEAGITYDYFRNLNLHDNRILNLGLPLNPGDATNRTYVDTKDALLLDRIVSLEGGSYTSGGIVWDMVTTENTLSIAPPYTFTRCTLIVDGVHQTPVKDFNIVNSVIVLTDWFLFENQHVLVYIDPTT